MLPRVVRDPSCIVPSVERVSISSGSSSPVLRSLSATSAWNSAWSSSGRAAAHFTCALRTNIANSQPMTFVRRKQPACLPTKRCLRWAGRGFALQKSPKRQTGRQRRQSLANRPLRLSKASRRCSRLYVRRRKSSSRWETWRLLRKINPMRKANLLDGGVAFLPKAVTWPNGLAPARHRDAEQECDKQACERRFPGDGADRGKRLSRLAGGCDRFA